MKDNDWTLIIIGLLFIGCVVIGARREADSYDEGYSDGYDSGYDEGYSEAENEYDDDYREGYDDGEENGFDNGYQQGYDEGYVDGYNDASDGTPVASSLVPQIDRNSGSPSASNNQESVTDILLKYGLTPETVYITSNGTKYHRDGCPYLGNSKIAISIYDAKDLGYTACSKCW